MIYELRVYRVVQGRMAALLTRFEHQTLPIMVRHGILQIGFWDFVATKLRGFRRGNLKKRNYVH
jgi:hypothetical protein